MRYKVVWVLLCGAILSVSSLTMLFADRPPRGENVPPGAMPFTPSRIEWLVTDLNASGRVDNSCETRHLLTYTYAYPDTVVIYVRYYPSVVREVLDISLNSAHELVRITAQQHGWSSWVRVKENVRMTKPVNCDGDGSHPESSLAPS